MVRTIRRSYFGVLAVLAAMALLCMLAGSSAAAAGDTTLVSADSSGNPANDGSSYPSISADGRYVAFGSGASNLVENDTNDAPDIFVRDLQTGTNELVSVDSSGNQTNDGGGYEVRGISADGRYVVFLSSSATLVENDTNGLYDVFVHDRDAGTTERVSVDSSENQANGESSLATGSTVGAISVDGRYVVFDSLASNLVENDTNDLQDVFVRDRNMGTTERVSVDSSENQANGESYTPNISADGRYVSFGSLAAALAEGQGGGNIFVRDLTEGTTEVASVDSFGNPMNVPLYSTISADGRYVAFTSASDEPLVHDRETGANHLVNLTGCATQANGGYYTTISGDGRYVAFASADANNVSHIFAHDMHTGTTEQVSVDSSGNQANDFSHSPSVSADGRVAFFSGASNLVENDTNGFWDVFMHDLQTGTTQPDDEIAPTTTACAITNSGAYESGTWTNQDVQVSFSAQDDEGGSGTKDIHFSATDAQIIPEAVYNTYNSPVINTEGTTTISYFATDNAGNQESPAKTFTVKVDKTPPEVSETSPANNATGVKPTANISATFLESGAGIDPDSIGFSVEQVKRTGNVPVEGTLGYLETSTSKKATFDPSLSLAKGTYQASISVNDKAGNVLANDTFSWTFATTGPPPRR